MESAVAAVPVLYNSGLEGWRAQRRNAERCVVRSMDFVNLQGLVDLSEILPGFPIPKDYELVLGSQVPSKNF